MRTRLTIMVIGIAALIGLLLLSLPDVEDIPREKMTSISMAMCLADIKIDIRTKLEQGQVITSEYEIQCPELVDRLNITAAGTIEAFNSGQDIRLTFIPVKMAEQVKWTCRGTPAEYVPKACQSRDKD